MSIWPLQGADLWPDKVKEGSQHIKQIWEKCQAPTGHYHYNIINHGFKFPLWNFISIHTISTILFNNLHFFTGKAAEVQNVNQDVRQRSNDTVESSKQKLPSKPQKKQNTGSPGTLLLDLLGHIARVKKFSQRCTKKSLSRNL